MAVVVTVALAGLWASGSFGHDHSSHRHDHGPSRPRLVTDDDVEVALVGFERLSDGHAGVNSPVLPMNSAGMPMSGMGPIGDAIEKGQERVAVSVLFHNRGNRAHEYSPDRFSLTSSGRSVELLRRPQSTFAPGALVPGARLSATVYLVMPEGTSPLALSYDGHGPLPLVGASPAGSAGEGDHGH